MPSQIRTRRVLLTTNTRNYTRAVVKKDSISLSRDTKILTGIAEHGLGPLKD